MSGMNYPFRPVEHWGKGGCELFPVAFRGKEHCARAAPANLHHEGAVIVAITGGAFSVNSKRARTCG